MSACDPLRTFLAPLPPKRGRNLAISSSEPLSERRSTNAARLGGMK
jgi:hypothetical protein